MVAKAAIPAMIDDFTHLVSVDPGGATTDDNDNDDGSKLSPDDDCTKCKCGDFTKVILVTLDTLLPPSLMPVHALAVTDAATEPMLPDRFLPNAETGPPAGTHSCRLSRLSLSHPQQQPPIIIAENGTTPCSFPRRSSL